MSEWKKVKIGDFLTESKILAEESDAAHRITVRLNCKGVEKRGLKAEKEGATKYYTRYAGQFIYGKQNIHKGAFGIIPSELDGYTSSADLPAFDIDESKCVPEWIPLSLKVNERYKTLQKEVKGVGSQRLAVNVFLNVEIPLPEVSIQREILAKVGKKITSIALLDDEIEKQKNYVKQLRQNILQEAIEGKLTEEWRKENPVVKGNPDFDAEALFEKIQEEKLKNENGKGKTQNPLFYENLDIPKNWLFPLLNEITKQITDGTHLTPNYVTQGEVFLSAQNIKPFCFIPINHRFVSKNDFEKYRNNRTPEKNDILMARVGAGIGEAAVIDTNLEFAFYVSLCLIKTFSNFMNPNYLAIVLNSSYGVRYAKNNISSSGTSAGNYNLGHIRALKIPLPPLAEQKEIVSRVEKLLANVTELEKQITEREEMTKQLMQSIMKDTFN